MCDKYSWVKPLKDKKFKTLLDAFIEILMNLIVNQTNYGQTKSLRKIKEKFYDKCMEDRLNNNDI